MTKTACGRLRPFRLEEIPLAVRVRAAENARPGALPDDENDPRDRLLAVLRAPILDEDARNQLIRAANDPSDRVYWIPVSAWEKVMK